MFGVVDSLRLRLEHRRKLARFSRWLPADRVVQTLEAERDAGAWHGDFQFVIDSAAPDFCCAGICSWYAPAPADAAVNAFPASAGEAQFSQLIDLAHLDKSRAMAIYRDQLLATSGTVVNWSDDWMRGDYVPNYHRAIDARRGGPGSELLSELHIPRAAAADYLATAAKIIRDDHAELIYGVLRLVEQDNETALAWARQPYASVIFNLHTQHDAASLARVAATFRRLLDAAIALGGSYYLTYHRYARPEQTLACYPQLPDVLRMKKKLDPHEVLDSDWDRYYRRVLKA
jgi:hypothetical protein